MDKAKVAALVKDELFPQWKAERERLDRIDDWYRWKHEQISLPRDVTREMRELRDLARTPWLWLVVATTAQALCVDGWRSIDLPDADAPWRTWLGNDMESRQDALHRAALAYGLGYATVLPGVGPDGSPMSAIRGRSPRRMYAVYAEPADDEWPMFALDVEVSGKDHYLVQLYDEEQRYTLSITKDGSKVNYVSDELHGAQVCPVVRYAPLLDLEGRADGEVEPFIGVAHRLNKTTFDRLLIQHFSSWKVRTVAGLAIPDTEEEKARQKLKLRHDDLLVAEDADTKFGTLPETPLDGIVRARQDDLKDLAAVSQTPTAALTGDLVNLSADGIVAARGQYKQKVLNFQRGLRKSHNQALRLGMHLEGRGDLAADLTGGVTWQDLDMQSMSSAVDALGKAAQMLQIPAQGLWHRVPGVDDSELADWKRLASSQDALTTLMSTLDRQAGAPGASGGA